MQTLKHLSDEQTDIKGQIQNAINEMNKCVRTHRKLIMIA